MTEFRGKPLLLLVLIAAAQFILVLDLTLILPLGPDLCEPLGIPSASLAWFAAAYAGAATVSGLIGARVLDRVDRRVALCAALVGLALANAAAALATSFTALLLARIFAGLCGGPTLAVAHAIVTERVDEARRGRAFGVVLGANALASIAGVPAMLELASRVSWSAPFAGLAGLAGLAALTLGLALPPMRGHLARASAPPPSLRRTEPALAYGLVFVVVAATFALAPNFSAYLQHNLGVPRSRLPALYMVGGSLSLVLMVVIGRAVDRVGASWTGAVISLVFAGLAAALLIAPRPWLPIEAVFAVLMATIACRNVVVRTLTARVPGPREVGRFLSLQTSVQQLASMTGAVLGAAFLSSEGQALVGVPAVASAAIVACLLAVPLIVVLERRLRARARSSTP